MTTSVMEFDYNDYKINILETPGHQDFAEDTYRTLTAVDSVIIVVDLSLIHILFNDCAKAEPPRRNLSKLKSIW